MVQRRTAWQWVLAVLVLAAGLGVLPVAPAGAASNGSWSVYPTTLPGGTPRVVFSPQLTPGETVDDSVTVSNISASSLTFDLYAADAFNTPGGGLSLRRRIDPIEGIGAWIRLAHSSVIVPSHASVAIPFVIVVPADATPGDHVGGIVAEETTGTPSSIGSVPINVVQAVGVRVLGRVRGPLVARVAARSPDVAIRRSTASLFGASTDAVVTVRVENHGNVVLTPVAHLKVTGAFGTGARRTFSVGPLLPGESVTRRYTVSVRAIGNLEAQVSVAAKGTHSSATTSQWAMPWGLVAIVVVILVLSVLTLVRWRRRRHRDEPDPSPGSDLVDDGSEEAGAEVVGEPTDSADGDGTKTTAGRADQNPDAED